jgi:hypothetical protein
VKIALFCFEASRDDNGRLKFRFALCVAMIHKAVSESLLALV